MKILAISDTHNFLPTIYLNKPVDLLIHAGDLTRTGTSEQLKAAKNWLDMIPAHHKLIVLGNHDWLFMNKPKKAKRIFNEYQVLIDQEINLYGLKIYGSPWQPKFCHWAFNLEPQALEIVWNKIPKNLDILITHCPPYGTLDNVPGDGSQGCEILAKHLALSPPKLHIFGHIHEGYGMRDTTYTTYINASICDGVYQPINPMLLIDIDLAHEFHIQDIQQLRSTND